MSSVCTKEFATGSLLGLRAAGLAKSEQGLDYGMDIRSRSSIPDENRRFISSPKRPKPVFLNRRATAWYRATRYSPGIDN